MSLPFFSADDVTSAVSMQEAIDAMEVAFSSVNNNTAESPLRITMPIGDHDAHHLSMPAYIHGGKYLTIKLINVHTKNPTMGYDLINGVIVIMDAKTGSATALIDGKSVTSLRTGAASGYATKILANNDAAHAVVFGNGVQAKTQIEAIQIVRDIKSINQSDKPFFIAVGFQEPHLPFVAPKKYWDLYDRNDIVLPFNNFFPPNAPQKANYFYELRKFTDIPNKGPISDEKAKELIHAYYACVSYIDAQIGLILDELDNQDLTSNTTVVLTSDHGFSLSEHGRWTKHNLFQYELKIPMVISSPKYKKNKTSESFVELVDLYPTLCDIAGLEIPDFAQGKSLIDNLKNPKKITSDIAFSIWKNGETLISNKYYYTEWSRKGNVTHRMLFDIENDEFQMNNIAEIKSYKPVVDSLSKILNKHIKSTK